MRVLRYARKIVTKRQTQRAAAVEAIITPSTQLTHQARYLAQCEYQLLHGRYANDTELRAHLLAPHTQCFWDRELTARKEAIRG